MIQFVISHTGTISGDIALHAAGYIMPTINLVLKRLHLSQEMINNQQKSQFLYAFVNNFMKISDVKEANVLELIAKYPKPSFPPNLY
jgi:hypothetical protein